MEIRKFATFVEETLIDGGREVVPPTRKAAALAVIKNPFVGKYQENLDKLTDIGEELGRILGRKAVEALGHQVEKVESYGKAAIVGMDGELEHAAAILHPKLGKPFRDEVGGGKAVIPATKKMGGPGTEIDVPLHYKDALFVRSHFDAMAVRLQDAPKADEIVVVLVVADSGRPHARIGGLKKEEAKKEDGLR
jgi:hypothetical protein